MKHLIILVITLQTHKDKHTVTCYKNIIENKKNADLKHISCSVAQLSY